MTRLAHTGCWGMVVALALLLPASPVLDARQGQSIPPGPTTSPPPPPSAPPGPATGPAPAPFVHAWTVPIAADTDIELLATPSLVLAAGPAVPVTARALSDGHLVWTSEMTSRALARADDLVYGAAGGQVYALAEASGTRRWTAELGEPGHDLAMSAEHLLVLSDRSVRALGRADGAAGWRAELSAPPATSLAVSGTVVVVGLQDRSVVALDPETGSMRWRTDLDDVPRSVTITGGLVYVTLPLVALCALLPSDGRIDWCTTELRVPAVGPPVRHGDHLYLALLDTTLRTFNPSTGTMLRRDSLKGRPATPPMPLGPTVVTPLSQNAFAVVSPSGAVSVVPAPGPGSRLSIRHAAISQDAETLVTLTIEVAESLYLSAYRPAPPVPARSWGPSGPSLGPVGPAGAIGPFGPTVPLSAPPNGEVDEDYRAARDDEPHAARERRAQRQRVHAVQQRVFGILGPGFGP